MTSLSGTAISSNRGALDMPDTGIAGSALPV